MVCQQDPLVILVELASPKRLDVVRQASGMWTSHYKFVKVEIILRSSTSELGKRVMLVLTENKAYS
jgi:hypothetical protein